MGRFFRRRRDSVQLKKRTEGTSNEISLSVLDATKDALDEQNSDRDGHRGPLPGVIGLFTLRGKKKQISTPEKDKRILLERDLVDEGSLAAARKLSVPAEASSGKHARIEGLAASSASWQPPREEVTRLKSSRRRGKLIAGVVGVAVVAALVAVGIVFTHGYFAHQETLRGQLEEAIELIDQADGPLMTLDELVTEQVALGSGVPTATQTVETADATATNATGVGAANTSASDVATANESESELSALEAQLADATAQLNRARSSVGELKDSISDARDVEVANDITAAIDARLSMIELGEAILEQSADLRQAQRLANDGYQALLEADDEVREAAEHANDTSQENAQAAIEHSEAAIEACERGKSALEAAQPLAPDIDLSAYETYCDLRIEALNAAVEADRNYLARDRNGAAAANDRYNELDEQAAAVAASLEGNPATAIGSVLVERIKPTVEAYSAARQQAGEADGLLRTFLDRRS